MNLRLVRAVAKAESADELHLGRLLILLRAFDRGRGNAVEGIMKLAKLDFLLRYPNCLERVLTAEKKNPKSVDIKDYERGSIETKMVRFRYGPWDGRYRKWIGLLMSKDLVVTYVKGKTVYVKLTDKGREVAGLMASLDEFRDIEKRSKLVVSVVGKMPATRLKDFIYETFPELLDMKWGEEITL